MVCLEGGSLGLASQINHIHKTYKMGRSPCCDESGLKKGPWTPEEDDKLIKHIHEHGHGSWRALPKLAGLNRCGKSCRLRWTNYLRPDIKRGKFSEEEEQTILHLHSILGNKWSAIATHLPGRTDNEIKNFWNTHLKKKLIQMGFDPMTHRPRTDIFSSLPHLIALANLKDLIENHSSWEEQAVRYQNDQAIQMARIQYIQNLLNPPVTNPSITDIETYNLLASNALTTSDLSKYGAIDESALFSHLPDLQAPCAYESPIEKCIQSSEMPTMLSHSQTQSQRENSPWITSISSQSPPPVVGPPAVAADGSAMNTGDAGSSSSYGETPPSFWPDLLLEDPLFHEIA